MIVSAVHQPIASMSAATRAIGDTSAYTNQQTFIPAFITLLQGAAYRFPAISGGTTLNIVIGNAVSTNMHQSIITRVRSNMTPQIRPSDAPCLGVYRWKIPERGAASAMLSSDGTAFTLHAANMDEGVSTLALTSLSHEMNCIAFFDFKWADGILQAQNIMVDRRHRGKGLATALQRIAYFMAGRPPKIAIANIAESHPAFQEIADAHLDSGILTPFAPTGLMRSMSKVLDAQVTGARLLNPDRIVVKLSRGYVLKYAAGTAFEIAMTVEDVKKTTSP